MKKLLIFMAAVMLIAPPVSARPHGWGNAQRPHHERPLPRRHYHLGWSNGFVVGMVGGMIGGLLTGSRYEKPLPRPVYVTVPAERNICSTTVTNGVVVQNCVGQPAVSQNVYYF